MSWSHITPDSKIVVPQQKTGWRLLIQLDRDLVATLASAAKREHISILTTMFGRPFSCQSIVLGPLTVDDSVVLSTPHEHGPNQFVE